jgi:uncharacterized HAD superfamily protein
MAKKTIAVDLDDVLAANAEGFVKFSNERWGTTLQAEDFHEDLVTLWGIDHEAVNDRMLEYCEAEIVRDYGYFADALPVLRQLKERYKLVLVTARRKVLIKATADWVNQYLPDIFEGIHHAGFFDKLEPNSFHLTKTEILRELGADFLIDDQLKHCFAAAKAGIPSLLFGEYGWNQAEKLPAGVTRVKDWQAIEEYFNAQGR